MTTTNAPLDLVASKILTPPRAADFGLNELI